MLKKIIGIHTIGNRKKQKETETYKKNQEIELKASGLQQQQHRSRFLEASLVWQADGKLKNYLLTKSFFCSKNLFSVGCASLNSKSEVMLW